MKPSKKQFLPGLNHFNLSIEILKFLSQVDLARHVTRLSRASYRLAYSSLLWSHIEIENKTQSLTKDYSSLLWRHIKIENGSQSLIKDLETLNQMVCDRLKQTQYITALDLSEVDSHETNNGLWNTLSTISPTLQELNFPWQYATILDDLKNLNFERLRVLHLPAMETNS